LLYHTISYENVLVYIFSFKLLCLLLVRKPRVFNLSSLSYLYFTLERFYSHKKLLKCFLRHTYCVRTSKLYLLIYQLAHAMKLYVCSLCIDYRPYNLEVAENIVYISMFYVGVIGCPAFLVLGFFDTYMYPELYHIIICIMDVYNM